MKLVAATDPILLAKAKLVEFPDAFLPKLFSDMLVTMLQNGGCGLAAPQVGVSLRLFTYRVGTEMGIVVNPEIIERGSELVETTEGCLTFPNQVWKTRRPKELLVKYCDLAGKSHTRWLGKKDTDTDRLLSIVFSHECDHLEGILLPQHGQEERGNG